MKRLRHHCVELHLLVCAIAPSALAQTAGGQTTVDSAQHQSPSNRPSSSASEPDSALVWGHRGLREFGRGEYRGALASFERAEELQHSPVFLLYMARAHQKLGNLVEAKSLYRRVIDDPEAEQGPPAWQQAVRDARSELNGLEPTTTPEEAEHRLSPSAAPTTAEPSRSRSRTATESAEKTADPVARPAARTIKPVSPASPSPPSISSEGSTPRRPAAYAALGVGGLGLVLATVTGAMAVSRANEVKSRCVGTVCRPEDEPLVYEANRFGNLATVGAVVAITGAATGVTLLLWPKGETHRARASSARMGEGPEDPAVWLQVGPAEVALHGHF